MVPSRAENLIRTRLEALGCRVEAHAALQGTSGVCHDFTLRADWQGEGEFVIDVDGSGRPATISLVALRAKAFDTGLGRLFLVTDSPMDEEARRLAELYDVHVIPAEISLDELKRELQGLTDMCRVCAQPMAADEF